MSETTITIEGVSLVEFYGSNNAKFDVLKNSFPKLKLIPRGSKIKVIGSKEDIGVFESKVDSIVDFLQKYGAIKVSHIEELLGGFEPTNIPQRKDNVILFGPNGNVIKAKTPNQMRMISESDKNDIVFAIGPAGTGKTYTAVALAVKALKNRVVKKIVLTRPAVEAGESLGFLPGDLKDKIDPYLRPLYDALDDMIPVEKLNYMMANRIIEIAPLAYMRGRTIDNAFIILDEAQNATRSQLKMFLTRIGPNAKCIITGDLTQIDLPRNVKSGLKQSIHILEHIKGISHVYLSTEDVIRHKLVKQIIKAYQDAEDAEETEYLNKNENKGKPKEVVKPKEDKPQKV
ncbi:MAG: PhoH family protein [Chitinophagales bacterium]